MKKRILSILLTMAMVIGLLPSFAQPATAADNVWDGSSDTSWYNKNNSAFYIKSAEELAGLAILVNDKSITFRGITIYLTADIDLGAKNGKVWVPIGKKNASDNACFFGGTFDGQGHIISNVNARVEDGISCFYVGLFGSADYIKNLGVIDINSYASVNADKNTTSCYAGGIAGFIMEKIENCYTYSTPNTTPEAKVEVITSSFVGNDILAAGAGGITGGIGNGGVYGCYSNSYACGTKNIGAIVGRNRSLRLNDSCSCYWYSNSLEAIGSGHGLINSSRYTDNNTLVNNLNAWVAEQKNTTLYTWKIENGCVVHDVPWSDSYSASVTVKRDGRNWTTDAPIITIGTSSDTATANGSSFVKGTYNIYADGIDTNADVTVGTSAATATLNYYTLTATAGTGVTSVTGDGAYLGGASVSVDAVVANGYTWEKWTSGTESTPAGSTIKKYSFTMPSSAIKLTASATANTYTATVTVNKNDSAWKDGTPVIKLSASSSSLMYTVTGTNSGGIYTFTGLTKGIKDLEYYVWVDDTTDTYTHESVSDSRTSATLDYYTVTYQLGSYGSGTVPSETTVLSGSTVTIDSSLPITRSGYSHTGWSTDNSGAGDAKHYDYYVSKQTGFYPVWKADAPKAPSLSSKTDTTITLSPTSGYEYSQDAKKWVGNNVFSGLTASKDYNFYQRVAASGTSLASEISQLFRATTKHGALATPTAAISSVTSNSITVTSVNVGEYSKDGGSTWQDGNKFAGLTAATKYTFAVRRKGTEAAMPSATSEPVEQYTAATTPTAGEGYTIDYSYETITVLSGYEISTSNFGMPIALNGERKFTLTPGTTYYVRKAVNTATTPNTPASAAANFTVASKPVAPSDSAYSFDYHDEQIIFSNTYEVYTANAGSGSPVASDTTTITPGSNLYIRVKATSSASASDFTAISIPARPEAAGLSITTSKTDTTITVTAIDGAEYSKDGRTTWQPSNEFTGLTANTDYSITIRYAATDKAFASAALTSVTVKTKTSAATAPSSPSIKSQTCESITINIVKGNQYVITTNSTEPTTWDAAETTDGVKTFPSLTAATQYYIWVRQAETETAMTSKASSASAYTAAATPAASVVSINYDAETITFDSVYEVSTTSDFTGTAVTSGSSITAYISDNGTGAKNFYVRVKAITIGAPASLCTPVTIPARPQTPVAVGSNETVSNKNDGKITGVTTAMEWSVAGGTYGAVTVEQALNGITGLSDGTYNVRIKAVDDTSFKSVEQEITIASGHTITVTFDSKGGSDVASIKDKAYGDSIAAPADPTRKGFYFAGWYKEATCENVWTFALDKLTDNMTLFAKWSAIPTYTVTGKAVDGTSSAVEAATVKIMQGTVQFGTTGVTDKNGDFKIGNVPSGTYNLVITKGNRSAVIKVEVSSRNIAIGNVALPSGDANSVLVINGTDTPDVVIGGLNTEANSQLSTNTSVEMTLTVEKKDAKTAEHGSNVSSKVTSAGQQVGMILEINLSKSVNRSDPAPVLEASNLIEVIIPIPAELQSKSTYAVYRYHGTGVDAIAERENADHEKIVIDRTNHTITLYTKKFSTYAIGYTNPSSGGGSVSSSYTITSSAGEGGSISPSGSGSVTGGESKTFTITANKGYKISDVKVDGKSVGAVGGYTFSNVISTHTIAATFERTKATALPYFIANGKYVFIGFSTDKNGTMNYIVPKGVTVLFKENAKSFTDIAGHWAKNNIDFVTERELFLGTGGSEFSPLSGMTRAMFATVIGRLYERSYGELAAKNGHAFTDVNYGDYYGAYIDWAAENNIITGVGGGLFEPEREITRQEMASILYRFAKSLKALPNGVADVALAYPDSTDIEIWAREAALYCQKTGIITGRDGGKFVPQGTATRDEVAAILQRFIENTVK